MAVPLVQRQQRVGVGVVNVGRRRVDREPCALGARDRHRGARLEVLLQVVRALERSRGAHADRHGVALRDRVPSAEGHDRLAEDRSVHARLQRVGDTVSVFEADDRAAVQTEQILREIRERASAEVPGESMRQAEVAAMLLHRQRRRQVDDGLVDLGGRNRRRRHGRCVVLGAESRGRDERNDDEPCYADVPVRPHVVPARMARDVPAAVAATGLIGSTFLPAASLDLTVWVRRYGVRKVRTDGLHMQRTG